MAKHNFKTALALQCLKELQSNLPCDVISTEFYMFFNTDLYLNISMGRHFDQMVKKSGLHRTIKELPVLFIVIAASTQIP
uniref:Uncharacterized protein n=1 Tax=Medicago truncatula TaxID=3880 RepID=A2Q1J8_MEDTR|nr:hypothetical protein MtrDRAFT_AC148915g18v2 [Medicago truncatula]